MSTADSSYPAGLTFDAPERLARWRPLVQWFLAIPHLVIVWALGYVSQVVAVISWFWALITGRLPGGLAGFQAMYLRYSNRATMYAGFLHDKYPPFSFDTNGPDPENYPNLRIDLDPELEGRNRLTVLFRLLLVIPHAVVLFFLGIAAAVVWIIGFFVVIILGRWPDGMRDFVVGVLRWTLRVDAYFLLLTDQYPPFSLGGGAPGTVGAPSSPTGPDWSPQPGPTPA